MIGESSTQIKDREHLELQEHFRKVSKRSGLDRWKGVTAGRAQKEQEQKNTTGRGKSQSLNHFTEVTPDPESRPKSVLSQW